MNSQKAESAGQPSEGQANRPPGTLKLWAGVGVPVLAWGLHLFLSYGLVEWYCENPGRFDPMTIQQCLYVLTLAGLLLAFGGIWLNWRNSQQMKRSTATISGRARFMVNGGWILGPFLWVVIVVQGLPSLVLVPCI